MTVEGLEFVSKFFESLDIPYQFIEWKDKIPERYYTGEYTEVEMMNEEENGESETSIMINGFTRGSWMIFERDKEAIKNALPKKIMFKSGAGAVLLYRNAFPVPQEDADDLKRIQINLTLKERGVQA